MPGPESLGSSNQYSPLGSNANCVCLVCAGGDEVAQQAIMRRLLPLLLLRKEETLQEHSRTKEVRRVKERRREERRERGRMCVYVCGCIRGSKLRRAQHCAMHNKRAAQHTVVLHRAWVSRACALLPQLPPHCRIAHLFSICSWQCQPFVCLCRPPLCCRLDALQASEASSSSLASTRPLGLPSFSRSGKRRTFWPIFPSND